MIAQERKFSLGTILTFLVQQESQSNSSGFGGGSWIYSGVSATRFWLIKYLKLQQYCLHKQRVFERPTSGMHLLLPSGLNLFPRDLILAFQLTVCLYFSHLVLSSRAWGRRFSHFGSHPFSYLKMRSQTKSPARGGSRCSFCAVCDTCVCCGALHQAGGSLPLSCLCCRWGTTQGNIYCTYNKWPGVCFWPGIELWMASIQMSNICNYQLLNNYRARAICRRRLANNFK